MTTDNSAASSTTFGGVKVKRTACGYWLDGTPCQQPAPYQVFFTDCPSCGESSRARCAGHGVCDEHAIHARNGNRRSPVDGSRLCVERITAQVALRSVIAS